MSRQHGTCNMSAEDSDIEHVEEASLFVYDPLGAVVTFDDLDTYTDDPFMETFWHATATIRVYGYINMSTTRTTCVAAALASGSNVSSGGVLTALVLVPCRGDRHCCRCSESRQWTLQRC